jgi:hypothetical protein
MIEVASLPEGISIPSSASSLIAQRFPAAHEVRERAVFTDTGEEVYVIRHETEGVDGISQA